MNERLGESTSHYAYTSWNTSITRYDSGNQDKIWLTTDRKLFFSGGEASDHQDEIDAKLEKDIIRKAIDDLGDMDTYRMANLEQYIHEGKIILSEEYKKELMR